MARRPKNRKVDSSIIEQGGATPIRALTVALMNRRDRKEDRKYQESLEDMGMFEDGGGRANVPTMKPRARPARIEQAARIKQEAAEAAAVEGGNNEARRRASDPQNFYEGGSVRGCKSIQSSGTGFSGNY
jgi:hypothetical protein